MGVFIEPDDLEAFAPEIDKGKAVQMIEDAEALAMLAAPCLKETEFQEDDAYRGAVKAVLRSAVLRWNDGGTGAITSAGAGQMQITTDTRTPRRSMFWPSEIEQLRALCGQFRGDGDRAAYGVNMLPPRGGSVHRPWCSLHFGATYCSCGADIAGKPIYEAGHP